MDSGAFLLGERQHKRVYFVFIKRSLYRKNKGKDEF